MVKNKMVVLISEKHAEFIFYLYERWQDEKEYEDFQDYIDVMKERIPEVLTGTKHQFGFIIKCDDGEIFVGVEKTKKELQMYVQYL